MTVSAEYAAGLIDGEGSIGSHARARNGRTYYTARVQIGMSRPGLPALRAMRSRWGGGLSQTRAASGRWEEAWTWTLSGKAAGLFLKEIQRHLMVKQEQAAVALDLELTKASQPKRRNGSTAWSWEHEMACAALKARLHELNQKGPRARSAEVT